MTPPAAVDTTPAGDDLDAIRADVRVGSLARTIIRETPETIVPAGDDLAAIRADVAAIRASLEALERAVADFGRGAAGLIEGMGQGGGGIFSILRGIL